VHLQVRQFKGLTVDEKCTTKEMSRTNWFTVRHYDTMEHLLQGNSTNEKLGEMKFYLTAAETQFAFSPRKSRTLPCVNTDAKNRSWLRRIVENCQLLQVSDLILHIVCVEAFTIRVEHI